VNRNLQHESNAPGGSHLCPRSVVLLLSTVHDRLGFPAEPFP